MGGSGGRRVRHRTGGYCGWACCCGDGGGRGAVPWFMFMFLEVKELGFGFAIGVPIILVGLPILLFAVLQLIKKDAY